MKMHWLIKALAVMLVLSLCFSFVACTGGGSDTTTNDPSTGNDGGNNDGGNNDGGNTDGGNQNENNTTTPVAEGNDGVFNYVLTQDGKAYILNGAVAGVSEGAIPATFCGLPIKEINAQAFKNNTLASFSLNGNEYFTVKSGVLYSKDAKTLLVYPGAKTATTFKPETSAIAIGAYAFAGNTILTEINFNKVTSIGDSAFENCSALATFSAPATTRPAACGKDAFAGTAFYLNEENWTNGILYLAYGSFQNKTRYLLVDANDTVEGDISLHTETWCIADYAFYGNDAITTVYCDDSLYCIGKYSFASCSAMTAFTFSSYKPTEIDTTTIGEGAFRDCTSLITFTIPFGVKNIESYSFAGCTSMKYMLMKPDANAISPTALTGTPIEYMFYDLVDSETTQVDPIKGPSPELSALKIHQEYFYDEDGKVSDTRHSYWRYVDGIPTLWTSED